MNIVWPAGKKAAFTFIDDTDDAFMPEIQEVYDLLYANGILSTKTVWVYPVRDPDESKGDCLSENEDYRNFVVELQRRGFEIALHNVGSGGYTRSETIKGLEYYRELLGSYPRIHINHSYNIENIYCGPRRFSFPLNKLVQILYPGYKGFQGDCLGSDYFWGDVHKKHIAFSRNYEIDDLNVSKRLPIPYRDSSYSDYANLMFASCFAPNQWIMARRLEQKNIDRLVHEGGCAIVYTHFGYYHQEGGLDGSFARAVERLGSRSDIWYAPVSTILDYLLSSGQAGGEISFIKKKSIEAHSLWTRIKYRYVNKIDDFHYKASLGESAKTRQLSSVQKGTGHV